MNKKIAAMIVITLMVGSVIPATVGATDTVEEIWIDGWTEAKLAKAGDILVLYAETNLVTGVTVDADIYRYEVPEDLVDDMFQFVLGSPWSYLVENGITLFDIENFEKTLIDSVDLTYDTTEMIWSYDYLLPVDEKGGIFAAEFTATLGGQEAIDTPMEHLQILFDRLLELEAAVDDFLANEVTDVRADIMAEWDILNGTINDNGGISGLLIDVTTDNPDYQALVTAHGSNMSYEYLFTFLSSLEEAAASDELQTLLDYAYWLVGKVAGLDLTVGSRDLPMELPELDLDYIESLETVLDLLLIFPDQDGVDLAMDDLMATEAYIQFKAAVQAIDTTDAKVMMLQEGVEGAVDLLDTDELTLLINATMDMVEDVESDPLAIQSPLLRSIAITNTDEWGNQGDLMENVSEWKDWQESVFNVVAFNETFQAIQTFVNNTMEIVDEFGSMIQNMTTLPDAAMAVAEYAGTHLDEEWFDDETQTQHYEFFVGEWADDFPAAALTLSIEHELEMMVNITTPSGVVITETFAAVDDDMMPHADFHMDGTDLPFRFKFNADNSYDERPHYEDGEDDPYHAKYQIENLESGTYNVTLWSEGNMWNADYWDNFMDVLIVEIVDELSVVVNTNLLLQTNVFIAMGQTGLAEFSLLSGNDPTAENGGGMVGEDINAFMLRIDPTARMEGMDDGSDDCEGDDCGPCEGDDCGPCEGDDCGPCEGDDCGGEWKPAAGIAWFEWDFGDGEAAETGHYNIDHDYATSGDYTVTLTVYDAMDNMDSMTMDIHVDEGRDEFSGMHIDYHTWQDWNDTEMRYTTNVHFNDNSIYNGDWSELNYTWSFPDGQTIYGNDFEYTFTDYGMWWVELNVTNTVTGEYWHYGHQLDLMEKDHDDKCEGDDCGGDCEGDDCGGDCEGDDCGGDCEGDDCGGDCEGDDCGGDDGGDGPNFEEFEEGLEIAQWATSDESPVRVLDQSMLVTDADGKVSYDFTPDRTGIYIIGATSFSSYGLGATASVVVVTDSYVTIDGLTFIDQMFGLPVYLNSGPLGEEVEWTVQGTTDGVIEYGIVGIPFNGFPQANIDGTVTGPEEGGEGQELDGNVSVGDVITWTPMHTLSLVGMVEEGEDYIENAFFAIVITPSTYGLSVTPEASLIPGSITSLSVDTDEGMPLETYGVAVFSDGVDPMAFGWTDYSEFMYGHLRQVKDTTMDLDDVMPPMESEILELIRSSDSVVWGIGGDAVVSLSAFMPEGQVSVLTLTTISVGDDLVHEAHIFSQVLFADDVSTNSSSSEVWAMIADADGDGVPDVDDAFPDDATETVDTDGDGVGDVADAFPNDANETLDSDGDGVGDEADAFPNDATETLDSDGDGIGDNADTDSIDTDGDGFVDSVDHFPNDSTEWADTDSDGVGDNADAFPTDATETVDTDGDGVGDNADADPNDPDVTTDEPDDTTDDDPVDTTIPGFEGVFVTLSLLGAVIIVRRRK